MAGVRGHDPVRRRARIRDADEPGPVAEPRAARAVRHGGRTQLLDSGRLRPSSGRRSAACCTWPAPRPSTRWSPCCSRSRCCMTFTLRGGQATRGPGRGDRLDALLVGTALRPASPAGARRDFARPVRRAVRRRDGAAAGLCGGRAARRARAGSAGCVRRQASAQRSAGAVLSVLPITRHVGRWMFGGVFVFGVATIVFGVSTTLLDVAASRSRCSAPATWSASTSGTCSCSWRHRMRSAAASARSMRCSSARRTSSVSSSPASRGLVRRRPRRRRRRLRDAARGTGLGASYFPELVAHGPHSQADRDNCISVQYPWRMRRADRKQVEKGRGAVTNPGRPLREHHARTGRRWLGLARTSRASRPRPCCIAEFPKHAITHNKSPDVPFDQSLNPYQGCEHGCIYCFARPAHAYLNLGPGLDFETRIFHKPGLARAAGPRDLRAGLPVQGDPPRRQHRSLSARRAHRCVRHARCSRCCSARVTR